VGLLSQGGSDGNEIAEEQDTPTAPVGIGALHELLNGCFNVGVLVRCDQEGAAPQRVAPLLSQGRDDDIESSLQDEQQLGWRVCKFGLWAVNFDRTDNGQSRGCDLQALLGVDSRLRPGGFLDEPSSLPVPSQGRTPLAAAEDNLEGHSDSETRRDLSVQFRAVSYTPLGEIVAAYDWPINEAFAIVSCESSWNPLAVSWDGTSFGLFQIHVIHAWRWPAFWSEWMNPSRNAEYAYELWAEQGWEPWLCA
jgi:hypothetical protein